MLKADYGNLLKEMRIRAGFTQEQLGAILHYSKSCISKFEKGTKQPSITTFMEWVYATGEQDRAAVLLFGIDVISNAHHLVNMMFTFWLI